MKKLIIVAVALAVALLAVMPLYAANTVRLEAVLAPTNAATPQGRAEFRHDLESGDRSLRVEFKDMQAAAFVAGDVVKVESVLAATGQRLTLGLVVLAGGSGVSGELRLDTRDGDNVPIHQEGDSIEVGGVLSGVLAAGWTHEDKYKDK